MPPRHFNRYKRFTTLWIQVHFTSSYTFHFIFVQISPSSCLSIYVKENPIHICPIHWFYKKTRRILFFRLPPLNRFFSVRKSRICWFTLYSSFYGDISHCVWLSIAPERYFSYKGSFEQNALLPKGNYPFSVNLRPGITCLRSDGCCMIILTDIGILERIHILWDSIWTEQLKEVKFKLNFQLQDLPLN